MKKILSLMLLFTGMVKAQVVNIPDENFKNRLLASNATTVPIAADEFNNYISVDANHDGEIQLSEASAIHILNVAVSNISDLTGIESFSNLRQLYCNDNSLTQLNVNSLTNLTALGCESNQLAQLEVGNLVNLTYLRCGGNPIAQIDFSNLTQLTYLNCSGINVNGFNFNGLVNLETLICSYCSLTELNLTALSHLIYLDCSDNFLTTLTIPHLHELKTLIAEFNQLTTVEVSGAQTFDYFDLANNQLTSLSFEYLTSISIFDIRNNQMQDLDLSNVYFLTEEGSYVLYTGNPLRTLNMKNGLLDGMNAYGAMNDINTWEFICGDDMSYELSLIQTNRPGVVVNSYCSFTPGGHYNTISGNIKYDSNNNGCDASDLNFKDIRVNLNDGTNSGAAFTDVSGNYGFFTMAGNYTLAPSVEHPDWFNITPASVTVPFADNNNHLSVQDFCIAPVGTHPDLEIVIAPIDGVRPGFLSTFQVSYKNKGNQALSGNIAVSYNDSILDFMTAGIPPSVQTSGLLTWNYTDLLPFESRHFYVEWQVNSPTDTPPVNLGDVLDFTAVIQPMDTDEVPADNVFVLHQTVVNSFAFNSISCLEGPVVAPSEIGNYLHYGINFENTGSAAAQNIVVKTIIDPAQFDISSLQLISSSFAADTRITGNKVEFIFNHVNLDIGGHGHILLKIKTNPLLETGDSVSRRADVFFDYNAPIDTGTVTTVFQDLSNTDFSDDASVTVSPNPASAEIIVTAKNTIKSIVLFDAVGRMMTSSWMQTKESKLDLAPYTSGIYFVKVITEKGSQVQKLVKK